MLLFETFYKFVRNKVMFESLINFKINQRVILNPFNMGGLYPSEYEKLKDRVGIVSKIITRNKEGKKLTGKIYVYWSGAKDYSPINYKNLKILTI